MSSLVLDLQQELMNPDFDLMISLRKAHVIASKLKLKEFDHWIQAELNGYTEKDSIPDYRAVSGRIMARHPTYGWIPVMLEDRSQEKYFSSKKAANPIAELLDSRKNLKSRFVIFYPGEEQAFLNAYSNFPIATQFALHITVSQVKSTVEKIANCLLEWTIKLETEGILGENMKFSNTETNAAKSIPQQINNYYGTVVNGDVNKSQVVSGNQNMLAFNPGNATDAVEEIQECLTKENLSNDDMEDAIEMLDEVLEKINTNKKPTIIKAMLGGLKDFLIGVGASATVALIEAKMQGLF